MKGTWQAVFCAAALCSGGRAFAQDSLLVELSVDGGRLRVRSGLEPDRTWEAVLSEAEVEAGRFRLGDGLEITPDTLYVHHRAWPSDRLGRLEVERRNGRVTVQIYDRGQGPPPLRTSNVMATSELVAVDSGRFVRGWVLGFGSTIDVQGEVNRSVVTVGGDVSVQSGGVVRGSVVALGGDVYKAADAFVYGDLYADNQQKFQPRWYEDPGQDPLGFHVSLDYTRVNGGLAWAGVRIGPQRGVAPRLAAFGGYAFGSELWHYRVGLERESWQGPLYYVGFYRDTKNDDSSVIASNENTIFALLFGLDYRDYYFAEGFQSRLGWAHGEHRRITVSYFNESLSPMTANTDQWSLLNGGAFPRNYETLWRTQDSSFVADFSGRLTYLKSEAQFRSPEYPDRRDGTWMIDLQLEASSPDLGSDFEYLRYGGRLTRHQPMWKNQLLRARVDLQASGGRLPATRYLYLGGIGNLRGFDHKEFFGDRAWFLNVEYGWSLGMLECFVLYDAGQVVQAGNFDGLPVLHDVGLGVQIQNTFRVQLAADARFERDPLVTFRFTRSF